MDYSSMDMDALNHEYDVWSDRAYQAMNHNDPRTQEMCNRITTYLYRLIRDGGSYYEP